MRPGPKLDKTRATNEGAYELLDAIMAAGETLSSSAGKLKVSLSHLSSVVSGRRMPGRDFASRCRKMYGIDQELWGKKRTGVKKAALHP